MDRKMTLTNGSSVGNSGTNPGGGFVGFDTANLSASANMQILLQTNNDLILSIYKTIVDSTQEINRKIEALRDDIRDIKLNQQRNDRVLQEEANMWRTHTEQLLNSQGTRHLQDVGQLQDMLMKMVIAQHPINQQQQPVAPIITAAPIMTTTVAPYIAAAPITTTTMAPITTTVAPITNTVAPITTPVAPITTTVAPITTPVAPITTTSLITTTSSTFSAVTTTTFGVTGTTIPFGGSLFGGGGANTTNSFANLAAKTAGGGFLLGSGGTATTEGTKTLFGASPFGGTASTGVNAKDFKFFSAPQTKTETRGDGGEESEKEDEAEDYTPDVHYEPVVPLPPEVEVVSGEEGEEVTFMARCKLYRYDRQTKENKERGLGDIKILFNPSTYKYRCVMRREKVFKICANFPIVHDLSLHKREQMPAVFTWACKDFSEDTINGLDETFTARFKDANIAEEFQQKVTEAIEAMN